jgi:hypothetical protein
VKLFEVIDNKDADKLYLVMELIKKGAVMSKGYWKAELNIDETEADKKTLGEDKARKYFRHLILGLDYRNRNILI